MLKKTISKVAAILFASTFFISCTQKKSQATISFVLNGGHFTDPNWSETTTLKGNSGTPLETEIPDPVYEDNYFVGWREKNKKTGEYVVINKRQYKNSKGETKENYYYPYIDDVFYAYFEPEMRIEFDLTSAKDYNGQLIAPKLNPKDFNNNILSGYSGKKIPSIDCLPTVSSDNEHLHFQYWYSKKPIIEVVNEKDNKTHYKMDETAEDGVYRFDKSFSNNSMEFLLSEQNSFTLYASYQEDSKVNVHFNLYKETNPYTGFETADDDVVTFQAKDKIESGLITAVARKTGIDLSDENDNTRKFYPTETKDLRFAGFYLDNEFKTQIYLTSFIPDHDVDIYLKWEKKVSVTLDYSTGIVGTLSNDTITDKYYQGDTLVSYDPLPSEGDSYKFIKDHTPVKENYQFLGFYNRNGGKTTTDDGNEIVTYFDLEKDQLVDDTTLIADYLEDPKLTLEYDYPIGYDDSQIDAEKKIENKIYHKKAGEDITSIVSDFKNRITNNSRFVISSMYTLKKVDSSGQLSPWEEEVTYMPSEDITYHLRLAYRPTISFETHFGQFNQTYSILQAYNESVLNEIINNGSSNEMSSCTLNDNWLNTKISSEKTITLNTTDKYFYDGTYFNSDLNDDVILPFTAVASETEIKSYTFYRKYTKAITLTLIPKANPTYSQNITCDVLPNGRLADFREDIKTALGNITFSNLFVQDKDESGQPLTDSDGNNIYQEITKLLPIEDCIVYYQ